MASPKDRRGHRPGNAQSLATSERLRALVRPLNYGKEHSPVGTSSLGSPTPRTARGKAVNLRLWWFVGVALGSWQNLWQHVPGVD